MHRKSAIENPGQTVGNEIFGAYLYLLNHPAHKTSNQCATFHPISPFFLVVFANSAPPLDPVYGALHRAGRVKNIWR